MNVPIHIKFLCHLSFVILFVFGVISDIIRVFGREKIRSLTEKNRQVRFKINPYI